MTATELRDSWESTALWKLLKDMRRGEAAKVAASLQAPLGLIERVLKSGSGATKDFTLHDADHSFRVAQWMHQLIPRDTVSKLSEYELAFLLLSAYLHDIGMTPDQGKVEWHRHYLLYGPTEDASECISSDATAFQGWLDDFAPGVVPPLALSGTVDRERLLLADKLVTHYCRHSHNDWSAAWIAEHLAASNTSLGRYERWTGDLITLCKSHHEGYEELCSKKFDPVVVGDAIVHLRYLACVLRIADILDVDPERTPDVVFRQRAINEKSLIYWYKDHDLNVTLDVDRVVKASARPRSALAEKAIRETVAAMEHELVLCARLAREMPFGHSSLHAKKLPYEWNLRDAVVLQISPRDDAYVYVEGDFRPNTHKLLELLAGTELYGNPMAAVRELLQNSFDAVREEIAHERLKRLEPANQTHETDLANAHLVTLEVIEDEGGLWLVCNDDGVGMTRQIITNDLLVSGHSRRRHILDLERRCEAAGFTLGRTGRFGIGILSYFMIGDRMVLTTRRSQRCGDDEGIGWEFETTGIDSFGELRKCSRGEHGTTVRLHVRDSARADFEVSLRRYLLDLLVYIPCRLRVAGKGTPLDIQPGWVRSREEIAATMLRGLEYVPVLPKGPVKSEWKEWIDATAQDMSDTLSGARESLVLDERRGTIEKMGRFRCVTASFRLGGDDCAGFIRLSRSGDPPRIKVLLVDVHSRAVYIPTALVRSGWCGTLVKMTFADLAPNEDTEFPGPLRCMALEIDWDREAAGKVAIDRLTMAMTLAGETALRKLLEQETRVTRQLISARPSRFGEVSRKILDIPLAEAREHNGSAQWAVSGADGLLEWQNVPFPTVGSLLLPHKVRWSWHGAPVAVLPMLEAKESTGQTYALSWAQRSPNKLVATPERKPFAVPLWVADFAGRDLATAEPVELSAEEGPFYTCAFPPAWSTLCSVSSSLWKSVQTVWNHDHPFVRSVVFMLRSSTGREWLKRLSGNREELSKHREHLVAVSEARIVWLMRFLNGPGHDTDTWEAVTQQDPELAAALLSQQTPGEHILIWDADEPESQLIELRSDRLTITEVKEWGDKLINPGPDWRLEQLTRKRRKQR